MHNIKKQFIKYILLFSDSFGLLIHRQQSLWYHYYTVFERISHCWSKYYTKNMLKDYWISLKFI